MKLKLTLADPEEVILTEFDARDRRAFERAGYKALGLSGPLQSAVQTVPDSYVAWLAFHSLKRQGLTTATFDEFDARLVDLDPEGGMEEDALENPIPPEILGGFL